jgi:FSR family fosmidomycin resistance protein-like MFS transporter
MAQAAATTATSPTTTDDQRFHTEDVVTISAGHAIHDTYTAFLPPLLPAFIESLNLSNTLAGGLTVFTQIPSLLQPVIGHLADRHNLRLLVILAPGLSAILMSLLGLAPTYFTLALLLMAVGLSSASLHAVGPVFVGRQSGTLLGRGMSFWMVGGELGRTVGPIIITTLVAGAGLQSTTWLLVGGIATSALLYWRLKDLPHHISTTTTQHEPQIPVKTVLIGMLPFLLPLAAVVGARAFLNVAITTYLPIFLTEEGASLVLAGAALSILEGAGVVGALVGGSISDRFGRGRVLTVSMSITPLLLFAFVAAGDVLRFPLLILLGLFALSITPVIMALVQERFPDNRALANGVYMAMNFVLRSGAVLIVGLLSDGLGTAIAFLICGGLALVAVPFLRLLTPAPASTTA